jgi:hypothetical protein
VLEYDASRNGRVLRFVLVIRAIKGYLSILGCHMTQPKIGQKLVLVNNEYLRAVRVYSGSRNIEVSIDTQQVYAHLPGVRRVHAYVAT